MTEVWKDIKGYDELYEVSNLGYARRKSSQNGKKHCKKDGKNRKGHSV